MRPPTTRTDERGLDRERLRDDFDRRLSRLLNRCLKNLLVLADGVQVQKTGKDGGPVTYELPPDRLANEYLVNRILGRPPVRKAIVDPAPPTPLRIDLSRIPIDRLETMERWLIEADEQSTTVDEAESQIGDCNPPPDSIRS